MATPEHGIQGAMILADHMHMGERYAKANGIPLKNVITPRSTTRARGREYDDLTIVGNPRLTMDQWAELTPALLTAGEHCINELERCYTGKLPPPIELKRKKVIKL